MNKIEALSEVEIESIIVDQQSIARFVVGKIGCVSFKAWVFDIELFARRHA